jgi:predicted RNA-binding Zn ribbon-like protein
MFHRLANADLPARVAVELGFRGGLFVDDDGAVATGVVTVSGATTLATTTFARTAVEVIACAAATTAGTATTAVAIVGASRVFSCVSHVTNYIGYVRQTADNALPTGQWFTSGSGHQWWFDSGSVALDFAYTGALGGNPEWERLQQPEDLAEWLEGRFSGVDGTVSDGDLRDGKALRQAIADVTTSAAAGRTLNPLDVDVINLFAATPDIPPALPGGSRQAGRATARARQAFAAMAREAVEIFAEDSLPRIRRCAADDCGLIFYDDSRSNNRRWCSMQRCGNRAKVRAHRTRTSPAA